MIYFIILNLIIFAILIFLLKSQKDLSLLKSKNQKLLLEQKKCERFNLLLQSQTEKQKEVMTRKIKILDYLEKHETITNDKVEAIFKVSNSTAYRILEDLEREGVISQIGKSGCNVFYIKKV